MWVVSFVIADYFRERLPAQTASGIGDFNIPTATEGRVVPIIPGGSIRANALNCIWYGDFAAIERTVTTGVIFKEDETIGFTYELALQYAICKSEVAGITGIWIGDDEVFNHDDDAGGIPQTVVDIDRDDLFGGTDNGGGFVGRVRLFNGSDTQPASAFLASRLNPLPAYTGTAYILVTDLTESFGANIGEANNLRYIRVAVQAFDTVANGGLGDVLGLGNDHHFIGPDANPISVAYDLFTNTRWGRSRPLSEMDTPSFVAAAETIWAEGIGYSQIIDEQTSTGEIQDTIEQHVDGYIGPNAVSGKIEVTLARQDYVLANEYQADASNILNIGKWTKGDWSQTYNRIRIRYTDRTKQWKETHAVELASGNRIIQGRTVTKELRYQGVHTADVASKIAARSKRSLAEPTSGGTVTLDRSAYELRPGSVFSLTSPKIGEDNLAVRVTKATIGNVERGNITVEVVSDQFGTEIANATIPPPSDFVPPIQLVAPFAVDDQAAFETPFILMRYDVAPNTVPRISTLARRTSGNTPTEYEVVRRTRNPPTAFAGVYTSTDFVRGGFTTVGALRNNETAWASGNGGLSLQIDPLGAESLDALIGTYAPGPASAAGIAVISPGLADEEFVIFDAIVDDLTGVRLENVWRAAMDTAWKAHAAGARIWFIWTGGLGMGSEVYNIGDGVEMKFLARSPSDAVLEAAATALPEVLIDENTGPRNSKPLLPIDLNINGQIFPASVDYETVHTTPSAFTGGAAVPKLRAFNNQNVLTQLQGLAFDQTGFNPADVVELGLELAWWLHDLDTNPSALRADAVAASAGYVAQASATDQFDIALADIIAGGAEGFSFNARLEIETRQSPSGQPALQVSHEPMLIDHVANGIFSVLPGAALFQSSFDGIDLATVAPDQSQYVRRINFSAGASIDTAQSVFGGASLLVDNTVGGVYTPARRGWDMRGDFTIEARLRFTSEATFPMIFEQLDNTNDRGIQVYYSPVGNTFNVNYSTTGANLNSFAAHTGTWVPVLDTWYAFALVKKGTAWSVYIDGTRLGAAVTQNSTYFRSSADFIIGGGGDAANFWDGHIDEFRIVPAALYSGASYALETVPFVRGIALYPLLCHFEDVDAVTTHNEDSPNHFTLAFTGTSAIDTAQFKFGASSALFNGNNDFVTPANQDGADIVETLSPLTDAAFDFKRGPFTFEGFFRLNALPSTNAGNGFCMIGKAWRGTSGGYDWFIYLNSTNNQLIFNRSPNGAVSSAQTLTATIPILVVDGVWRHWAVVRNGNALEIYYEGLRVAQDLTFFDASPDIWNNDSPNGGHNKVTVGYLGGLGSSSGPRKRAFNGWLDEMNVEKRAKYNGSSYTIPAAPIETPNDSLTVPADDYGFLWLADGPSDGYATDYTLQTDDLRGAWILFGGNAQMDTGVLGALGPSGVTVRFDGNGDYIQTARSQTMALVDDDFTLETRAYFTANPAAGGSSMIAQWWAGGSVRGFHFSVSDSNELEFHWSTDGVNDFRVFTAFTPTLNTWYDLAVVRSGASVFLFVDGVVQVNDGASDAIGADVIANPFRVWTLGHANDTAGLYYFAGNMQNIAWTRSAKWTTTYTPPAALYTPPALPNF